MPNSIRRVEHSWDFYIISKDLVMKNPPLEILAGIAVRAFVRSIYNSESEKIRISEFYYILTRKPHFVLVSTGVWSFRNGQARIEPKSQLVAVSAEDSDTLFEGGHTA
jgi:hypothetical protein